MREAQNNEANYRVDVGVADVVAKATADKSITPAQLAAELRRQGDIAGAITGILEFAKKYLPIPIP